MITVYYGNVNKRRNSTLQPTFSESNKYKCVLKEVTSFDHPTFIFSGNWIGWNVAKWGDRYYFVEDVRYVRNNIWEVECVLDVLATYKSEILNNTCFVSYSSNASSSFLPDMRIPTTTNVFTSGSALVPLTFLDINNGSYVLSVIGKDSAMSFITNISGVRLIAKELSTWKNDSITDINSGVNVGGYDFTSVENSIESLMKASTQTGFIGNAYSNALNCIRSCHWIPFDSSEFNSGHAYPVYLGEFDTGFDMSEASSNTKSFNYDVTIPWRYSDWRRGTIEHAFLYLPFCGVIALTDDIKSATSLRVSVGANAMDGSINYQVRDNGGIVIGTYGTKVSADYAIGVNQAASLGNIIQTGFAGLERTVGVAVGSSAVGALTGATVAGTALEGLKAMYDVANIEQTHTATCIGSFGASGVATGHINSIFCYTRSNSTIIEPSAMAATMGLPTMRPLQLSTLTGFCQCANAHISCNAHASALNAIDSYVNTGFFIE